MVEALIFTLFAVALWAITEWTEDKATRPICEECGVPMWNLHVWRQKLICGRCMETKS